MNNVESHRLDSRNADGPLTGFSLRFEVDGPWRRGSAAWIEPALMRGK